MYRCRWKYNSTWSYKCIWKNRRDAEIFLNLILSLTFLLLIESGVLKLPLWENYLCILKLSFCWKGGLDTFWRHIATGFFLFLRKSEKWGGYYFLAKIHWHHMWRIRYFKDSNNLIIWKKQFSNSKIEILFVIPIIIFYKETSILFQYRQKLAKNGIY